MDYNLPLITINIIGTVFCIILVVLFSGKKVINVYFILFLLSLAFVILILSGNYSDIIQVKEQYSIYYYISYIFLLSFLPLLYASIRKVRGNTYNRKDWKKWLLILLVFPILLPEIYSFKVLLRQHGGINNQITDIFSP